MPPHGDLALVLGGGGARAAYQVGVLRALARRLPDLRPPLITGVSAGAINSAHLANHQGTFHESVEALGELWRRLDVNKVFETKGASLFLRAFRSGARLLFGLPASVTPFEGMVDTRPLRTFLLDALHTEDGSLPGIEANLQRGTLSAVALTTTQYNTGQTVTFFAGRHIDAWERPQRISVATNLTVDHVMASAALPLVFPSVRLGDAWYGDGGVRLVAPLAPALHLGAGKVLVITTRYRRSETEAARPTFEGPPSPAQVLGVLYNSIFLDQLEQDGLTLERINALVRQLPPEERQGLREVRLMVIRPSMDIGALANEYELNLPGMFRHLTRQLGTRRARSQDFLSTLMFESRYMHRLLDLGDVDGEAAADDFVAFLS